MNLSVSAEHAGMLGDMMPEAAHAHEGKQAYIMAAAAFKGGGSRCTEGRENAGLQMSRLLRLLKAWLL